MRGSPTVPFGARASSSHGSWNSQQESLHSIGRLWTSHTSTEDDHSLVSVPTDYTHPSMRATSDFPCSSRSLLSTSLSLSCLLRDSDAMDYRPTTTAPTRKRANQTSAHSSLDHVCGPRLYLEPSIVTDGTPHLSRTPTTAAEFYRSQSMRSLSTRSTESTILIQSTAFGETIITTPRPLPVVERRSYARYSRPLSHRSASTLPRRYLASLHSPLRSCLRTSESCRPTVRRVSFDRCRPTERDGSPYLTDEETSAAWYQTSDYKLFKQEHQQITQQARAGSDYATYRRAFALVWRHACRTDDTDVSHDLPLGSVADSTARGLERGIFGSSLSRHRLAAVQAVVAAYSSETDSSVDEQAERVRRVAVKKSRPFCAWARLVALGDAQCVSGANSDSLEMMPTSPGRRPTSKRRNLLVQPCDYGGSHRHFDARSVPSRVSRNCRDLESDASITDGCSLLDEHASCRHLLQNRSHKVTPLVIAILANSTA